MSNSNKNTKVERIHEEFIKELKQISLARRNNELEDDDLSMKELTRMLKNTDHWNNVKQEMVTKPRRKDD